MKRNQYLSCKLVCLVCVALCQDDEDVGEADFQERLKAELDRSMKE